ncbi:G-D-S-L family lipolytic protein [Arthrobacter psychrolactophilus]|uniref:G-D-S-L family lipolytic protein n=1 Tax=Arthrobacter psychrolactophilus TaxID=92442 RepID=A0A2V5JA84_9MICC|nr:G-D-S-L family lipolytic protein [Arthrobacter psychrolactophilus]
MSRNEAAVEHQICFVGDSLVAGIGDETALGWSGRLVARQAAVGHPVTGYNLGIRGNTSAQILARCVNEVELRRSPRRPTRVVLSMGVNDTTHVDGAPRVPLAESCANLTAVLDAVAGDPVLVVGPPAVADDAQNDRIRELTGRYLELCRGRGVPYVEVFHVLECHPVWRQQVLEGDGAHPRSEGYQALYELVAPTWDRWLGASPRGGEELP